MSAKIDELIALDPDFIKGESKFEFPNGDVYEGEYCAHRSGIVWRQGVGTYITNDGQIYKGEWRDDQLVDSKDVDVSFPSGVEYYGKIVKSKYTGPGMYILENKMSLLCEFLGNKPYGEICLVDINGREWRGPAEDTEALLLPEHIYFNNIGEERGKGRIRSEPSKTKLSRTPSEKSESEHYSLHKKDAEYLKALELRIFGKCLKTADDLRFEDSEWYKEYVNFKKVYEDHMGKIKANGFDSLTKDEKNWYQKYAEFKNRYFEIMDARRHNKRRLSAYKLFELFHSKEFKASSVPVPVFYRRGKYAVYKEITFKDT
ncbi:hypothetical protein NQ318_002982 [Aromia moschata]|uniref:Uncharacterized protein n=1 Tax=Aromia moschata TaxID=1265417 RepID=A0AAV8YSC4_9CUCU|nr:hypothetical protein NQ318_002982 [Aromia moschata]